MSFRFDEPLMDGAYHFGDRGLGVLAETVPEDGDDGDPPLYDDLDFPEDIGKEVRFLILTQPSHGTLFMNEDSSFIYTPEAEFEGTDNFTGDVQIDGVSIGTETVYITVGEGGIVGTLAVTLDNFTANFIGSPVIVGTFAITLGNFTANFREIVASALGGRRRGQTRNRGR